MTEEVTPPKEEACCQAACENEPVKTEEAPVPYQRLKSKTKRDIVHFSGEKPTAIDLGHVAGMRRDGKTIFFDFLNRTQPIDMDSEEASKSIFESLLTLWAGDVVA